MEYIARRTDLLFFLTRDPVRLQVCIYTQTFAYITTLLKATVQVGSEPEQPAYI